MKTIDYNNYENDKLQRDLKQQIEEANKKFQHDSFPQDPVLLYELKVYTFGIENPIILYALPTIEVSDQIFFDIIDGDSLRERAFIGCSIIVTKMVFSSFHDVADIPALTVFNEERKCFRSSMVLLSIPGIRS